LTRDQLNSGRGRRQSPARLAGHARPLNRATNAGTAGHAGIEAQPIYVMVNTKKGNMQKREIKKIATVLKKMSVGDKLTLVEILISFEKQGNYSACGLYQMIRNKHPELWEREQHRLDMEAQGN